MVKLVLALFALALFALAWLAWYLGRAAGTAASSFREGYSTARVAAEEVTADDVLLRACAMADMLGAESAREAAEMTAGRALSDAEWERYGPPWERVWLLAVQSRASRVPSQAT